MSNKKLRISVSLIIIFISFILPASADPERMLPVCINGCHTERSISYGVAEDDECGSCHVYVSKSFINIPVLEQSHNPKTCKLCHNVRESGTFHTLHSNVTGSCNRCHGESGSAKPDKAFTDCAGCHGGQIHDIHEQNRDQVCLDCHGVAPAKAPQSRTESSTAINQLYAGVIDYQRYTLLELIKSLFRWK